MAIIPASIRNNNTGAQYPGPVARRFGGATYEVLRSKDGTHKIATFPSAVHGAAAHIALLHDKYTGLTLEAAIRKWCGGYYVSTYLKVLSDETGIGRATILTKELIRDSKVAIPICKAMALQEAGKPFPMSDEEWETAHDMAFSGDVAPVFDVANDVPSPKPETRRAEAVKTTGRWTAVVTGAGAVVTGVAENGVPSVPPKAAESLTNIGGWLDAGKGLKSKSLDVIGAPAMLIGVGLICLIWFGPKLIGRS